MLNINSISQSVTPKNVRNINFRAENSAQTKYVSPYEKQLNDIEKERKNQKRKNSLGQYLGIAGSAIMVLFFSILLKREIASSVAAKKAAKEMNLEGYNAKQIARALKEEAEKGMMGSNKKIQALKDLSEIPTNESLKEIDLKKAKEILDNEVIGMDGVKKQVLEFLEYRNQCIKQGIKPDKPLVISLDGPAGTAKTTLARAIAKAAGMPHKEINMAGATGKAKVIGNESVYTGASWGEFADAQLEYKTKNIVYTLDELEKTGTSDHNGKIEDTILPLLDGRHKIKDDFLGVDIDISDSIVVITTNDFMKLSEPLRDRISYKFKISPYTLDEKAAVAKFKFDKALKYHKIGDKVEYDDKIFKLIADSVSDEGGREVTDIAENIVHKIFIDTKGSSSKFQVTEDAVRNWIRESKQAA